MFLVRSKTRQPRGRELSKSHRDLSASPIRGTHNASEPLQQSVVAAHEASRCGHNTGAALSDADLISEVVARGLQSAVAAQRSECVNEHARLLVEPISRPLGPLAISVKTARELIGLGNTSMWGLIKSGDVDVVRIGRRTLVVAASLDALVASRIAAARRGGQARPENSVASNTMSSSLGGSAQKNAR